MAGTVAGGKLAAKKNKELYGEDYYARIGKTGGRKGRGSGYGGGFSANKVGIDGLTGRERARAAGALGGSISRRGASKDTLEVRRAVARQRQQVATREQVVLPQRRSNAFGRLWMGLRRMKGGEHERI